MKLKHAPISTWTHRQVLALSTVQAIDKYFTTLSEENAPRWQKLTTAEQVHIVRARARAMGPSAIRLQDARVRAVADLARVPAPLARAACSKPAWVSKSLRGASTAFRQRVFLMNYVWCVMTKR